MSDTHHNIVLECNPDASKRHRMARRQCASQPYPLDGTPILLGNSLVAPVLAAELKQPWGRPSTGIVRGHGPKTGRALVWEQPNTVLTSRSSQCHKNLRLPCGSPVCSGLASESYRCCSPLPPARSKRKSPSPAHPRCWWPRCPSRTCLL